MAKKSRRKIKKTEFSKIHVIFANFLVAVAFFVSFAANFYLANNERPQIDFAVPLAIVTIYGGFATGGYFTQNILRAQSLNKLKSVHAEFGIPKTEAHYD